MADLKQTSIDGRATIEDSEEENTAIIASNAAPAIFKLYDGSDVLYLKVEKSGGVISLSGFQEIDGRNIMTAFHKNPLFLFGIPDYFLDVEDLYKEAENCTISGNAGEVNNAQASPFREGTGRVVELNASGENILNSWVGGGTNDLSHHDYKLFLRYYSSSNVVDDLRIKIDNTTDTVNLLNQTFTTPAGAWDRIKTLAFTIDSNEDGDTIQVEISKDTTNSNTISLDFLYLLPCDEGVLSSL